MPLPISIGNLVRRSWFIAVVVVALCVAAGFSMPRKCAAADGVPSAQAAPKVDFKRDIEPVFAANCHSCHGPKETKNGLRLDRRDRALAGGDSGPVILPGNSKGSVLIRYATGENDDKVIMPPKGERLSAAQIQLLRNWIDQGAEWPDGSEPELAKPSEHWAFKPLNRPAVPVPGGSVISDRVVSEPVSAKGADASTGGKASSPTALTTDPLNTDHWRRNPIDAFILAKLRNEGIAPSPEADRRTLIHRLCLDLLGLPPAPGEVDLFVHDPDPAAYGRLVEHLLKSPHFGERWAPPPSD
jgi:mono/diheme cytochrome c family protein